MLSGPAVSPAWCTTWRPESRAAANTSANTDLFAPYKVATWGDILDSQKESTGLWIQDYGGFMSIGYDSSKVPEIKSIDDLFGSQFKGKVALNGNPKQANAALNGVMMANLAEGGSLDDVSKGVDFFKRLKVAGNFSKTQATTATVKNGTTPVVFDWDYLSAGHGKDVPTWKVFVPSNAILGGYYAQAVSKDAPHPAAAPSEQVHARTAGEPRRQSQLAQLGVALDRR